MPEMKKISLTFRGLSPQQVTDMAVGTTGKSWDERAKDSVDALTKVMDEKIGLDDWAQTPDGQEMVTKLQALLQRVTPHPRRPRFMV